MLVRKQVWLEGGKLAPLRVNAGLGAPECLICDRNRTTNGSELITGVPGYGGVNHMVKQSAHLEMGSVCQFIASSQRHAHWEMAAQVSIMGPNVQSLTETGRLSSAYKRPLDSHVTGSANHQIPLSAHPEMGLCVG